LPLGTPPVAPAFAAQQPEKQKQRVDPRLLEEAAARQQALAEGKIAPQKTVINPDAILYVPASSFCRYHVILNSPVRTFSPNTEGTKTSAARAY
jgi:hypothetical protein